MLLEIVCVSIKVASSSLKLLRDCSTGYLPVLSSSKTKQPFREKGVTTLHRGSGNVCLCPRQDPRWPMVRLINACGVGRW